MNLQERKFTDFNYVESRNWFMAEAIHALLRWNLNNGGPRAEGKGPR